MGATGRTGFDCPGASAHTGGRIIIALQDVYMRTGRLLHLTASADESVERMLLALRLLLNTCCDVLRPDEGLERVPLASIGTHVLSRRVLMDRPDGESLVAHFQELAFFDPGVQPYRSHVLGQELASLRLDLEPVASARSGLLSRAVVVAVDLRAQCALSLPVHEEEYIFTLPTLVLEEPLQGEEGRVGFEGQAQIRCRANGLLASRLLC